MHSRSSGHSRARGRASRPWLLLATSGMTCILLASCVSSADDDAHTGGAQREVMRPAAPAGELSEPLQRELSDALEQAMAEYGVPGASAGVWVPGKGSWTTGVGLANIEGDIAVTPDMVWPLRSVTKSYTVTLLLQLVDEGLLALDDPIDRYVDGVTDGDVITLRELADMSSGNADYVNGNFIEAYSEDPSQVFTLDELNGFMLGEPAQFAPGAERVYTNANTNLLGAVIEKVSGEAFVDVLQERILEPLGQDDTQYVTEVGEWRQPHAVGYIAEGGVPVAQDENPSIFAAAGSMFTDLDDARVWAEVLATGALLSTESQQARRVGAPLESGPPYDIYALGVGETDGWWGHNGEGIGFTAAVFHDPQSGASIAVFMNESNVVDAHPADQTFRRFAAILADESGE